MNGRDYDYIEARLLAPDVAAGEAVERLRVVGEDALAGQVVDAQRRFNDELREVRLELMRKRPR